MLGILGMAGIMGVFGIDDLIIGGLIIGIAALVSSCSGGNEEMEPLPSWDAGPHDHYVPPDGGNTVPTPSDGGGDGGVEQDAGGTTDTPDGGTPPPDDGGATDAPDAGTTPPDDGGEVADAGPQDGGTGPVDGGTTDITPPMTMGMYQCQLTASDIYGMYYSMYAGTPVPVVPVPPTQGFSGILRFAAAPGTPAGLEGQRINDPAASWPQAGQWIPDFAGTLIGHYWAQASIAGNAGQMSFENYNALWELQSATILPMTFADAGTGDPMPIAFDTSNEVYLAVDAPVTFDVACTAGMPDPCAVIEGEVEEGDPQWQPIANQPDVNRIHIRCDKLELR